MPSSVYIETSIISYLAARSSSDIVVAAHQRLTQRWWQERRSLFSLFMSELVLTEAGAGDAEAAERRLAIAAGIPSLSIVPPVEELALRIIQHAQLPARAAADTIHVAVAAVHRIDYLLTWNVRHIANAEVRRAVEAACHAGGFTPPVLCTQKS